ncbi:MAG TPA: protoporphyrinogen oxidase, partial [Bacteroidales bacterium]|nr:protoporphyrinogen oxidase [Bacteroidales bacterium]
MSKEKVDVVVIGAGLTGLTAAYYLSKNNKSVKVIEQNKNIGGVIQTHREDEFVYESGPNTGVLSTPEAAELLEDLSDLCKLEIADEAAKNRWVWKGDSWQELPSGLMGGITTPLFALKDKFRILGEPFRKKGTNPNESLDQLVKRRMGKSFLEYAVDPFVLGIYAGDPSYLVPRFALPKLYNLEQNYGSFIGGAMKKKKEPKSEQEKKATREVFSVEGGLSNLTDAL